MHRPLPHTPAVLAQNRRHYERLVELAVHHAGRGDVERVLRAATVAGNYAWLVPVGLLSDLRLERTVVHAVRGPGAVTVDGGRETGRVLHVLSEAYAVGGHTRQATEWMNRDPRTSDVVLTNQRGPVPDRVLESLRSSGGELHDLLPTTPGLLDRARALRRLMDAADLVVLTVHPYDAVALAAVNLPGSRPPVVYANHADHAFWLGVAGADLVCDWRVRARTLHAALRGVPDQRIGVLPLPMGPLPAASGEVLRQQLGIRPDAVVAVTVSADWKVAPAWGRGMHQVLDRVLHWSPQLSVVLVGVDPGPDWARLARRHPNRVFPVGRVPDPAPYLDLADVYLESYPVQAGTTPLEAALAGLPVVTLTDLPDDDLARIFQSPSPGLAGRPQAATAEKFAVAVRRLVADPELRRREGADGRAAVLAVHDGPGWLAAMEALYAQVRALPAVDVDDLGDSRADDRYGAMVLSATCPAPASPEPQQLAAPLGELFDAAMEADLFALSHRDLGPSLTVRTAAGWEAQPALTTRLLRLAGDHPRLTVSFPFAAGDDARGTRSAARLTELLAGIGQTPDSCGDIRVDSVAPAAVPQVAGELPFAPAALDRLTALVSSPCWDASRPPARADGPAPVPGPRAASAAEHSAPPAEELSSVL